MANTQNAARAGRSIRLRWATSVAVIAAIAALGCASGGRRFDPDSVPAIQRGRWTQREVRARFGSPTSVSTRGSGGSTWSYSFSQTSTVSTGTVANIAAFFASLAGRQVIVPPVNVSRSNTTVDSLSVEFDDRGVVSDYQYSRTNTPSRAIN